MRRESEAGARVINRYDAFGQRALQAALVLIALLALLTLTATEADEQKTSTKPEPRGSYRGAVATEYPDWFKRSFLEFAEDLQDAAAVGKHVLLLFHQDNCPYCNTPWSNAISAKKTSSTHSAGASMLSPSIFGAIAMSSL